MPGAAHSKLHQRCVEDAREDDPATWCDETDWRELSSYTERPDSVVQLAHLYDHPRAGTINLFPRAGVGSYPGATLARPSMKRTRSSDCLVRRWRDRKAAHVFALQ